MILYLDDYGLVGCFTRLDQPDHLSDSLADQHRVQRGLLSGLSGHRQPKLLQLKLKGVHGRIRQAVGGHDRRSPNRSENKPKNQRQFY
jgi:hypothetical protein